MILTIRTDKPEAELGLYNGHKELGYIKWQADRQLSQDIHKKLDGLFKEQDISYPDLKGVVVYKGPGSFTGLRIGISVANTIASEIDIPIAGSSSEDWISEGIRLLPQNSKVRLVLPEYGSAPKTTKPKK
ncbi:MAG TPA: tRNA (adenosine(37)-N6)-threonylcarbamoyltransferase complex dimerization subunit type 1 TsaB [Patescibacteria group bacterium]|nr:tRNA (adenosine(37)-N6)-threonylcarbamoyltransferase complex dimerization subunit type 1 TsaB [Patescibacteria group bacterium]